jgi:Na+/proline symporter
LPAHDVAVLTGKRFFPELISAPFHQGLVAVFTSATAMAIIAAIASALRGGRYTHKEETPAERKEANI